MRFTLKLHTLIIALFFINSAVFAGVYPFNQRLSTTPANPIGTGSYTVVTVSPLIPPGGVAFNDASVLDQITLAVDQTNMTYFHKPATITVHLKVQQWGISGQMLKTSYPQLTINYQPFSVTTPYIDKAVYNFTGAYSYAITIDSIVQDNVVVPTLQANLYISTDILLVRYLDFSTPSTNQITINPFEATDTIDFDCDGVIDELQINWPTIPGAEEYDLEWTYINDYDTVVGAYITPTPGNLPIDFRHNSTRIETSNTYYNITMIFEHGYLLYRVRGIGRNLANPNQNMVGVWSAPDTGTVFSLPDNYHILRAHENSLNWQFSATYAEEAKKKEVVSYFDGSLRNRQSVTKINSDKNAIVGETIYDHQGRPAINVLPVPVKKLVCTADSVSAIRYYPVFNKVNDSAAAYNRADFDLDSSPNDSCSAQTIGMDTSSGASNYYSPANPYKVGAQAFVPDGQLYPFTQVEYTPDNTGRIRRQGGVGPAYQLGTGHETKYFYGQPYQVQLDRMFGDEVGYCAHYKKNMVVDANGQVSVSYLDQEGRTIATSLAGNVPLDSAGTKQIVQPLASEATADTNLTVDLFAKDANGVSSTNTVNVQGNAIVFNTDLLVAYQSDYAFTYNLSVDTLFDGCLKSHICFNCIYDLAISVTDDCGRLVTPERGANPVSKTVGHFTNLGDTAIAFNTICTSPTSELIEVDTFRLNLPIGNYTVSKTLTINNNALNFYVNSYLDTVNAPGQLGQYVNINTGCLRTYQSFLDSALAHVDTADCNISCNTCVHSLQTINGTYYPTAADARDAYVAAGNGTELDFDYRLQQCEQPCLPTSNCQSEYEMLLMDVSPSGQYAQYQPTVDASGRVIRPDSSLSVLNVSNVLPQNIANGTGNWKHPLVEVNGTPYPYYLDATGVRTIITITANPDTSKHNYLPPVSDTTLGKGVFTQTDSLGNVLLYTYPENLDTISDFVRYWDNNWAQSLVQYHPEYCYYQTCLSYSTIPAGFILSSDQFDQLLENTRSMSEARSLAPTLVQGDTLNFTSDPYESNLAVKIDNYKFDSVSMSYYSMIELAAISARCATQYGSSPAHNSPCTQFGSGTDTTILNAEWNTAKNFYVTTKQQLQAHQADAIAINSCSSYNGCIGDSTYSPQASGMYLVGGQGQYFNNLQPCSQNYYLYYLKKTKRFSPQSNDPSLSSPDINAIDYQVYLQTGECPLAYDLQNLLASLVQHQQLATTDSLENVSAFTQDLYKALSGDTLPPAYIPYVWVPDTTGGTLKVNITDNAGTVCTLQLTKPAGISWEGISGFSQLAYTATSGGLYHFSIVAAVANHTDSLKPFTYVTLQGSTCFKITGCSFQKECEANDLANNLSNLWSALALNNQLNSQNVSLSSTLYKSFVTTPIENALGTTNTALTWNYHSADSTFQLYDPANSTKKMVIKFSSFGSSIYNSATLTPNIKAFSGIAADSAKPNAFTVKGVGANNVIKVSIVGVINVIQGLDTTAISMGSCALPTPVGCTGDPFQLRADLQALLANALLKKPLNTSDIDLTKSVYFSNLIAVYAIPSTQNPAVKPLGSSLYDFYVMDAAGDHEEQLYFNTDCPTGGCSIVLNHIVRTTAPTATFANLTSFTRLTGTGTSFDNNYYEFYALATYASGAADTIFGYSCLPLQNCVTEPSPDTNATTQPPYVNPCILSQINMAKSSAQVGYNSYIDSVTTSIASNYVTHCLGAFEKFKTNYNDKEYHFTLYYYDQAGNLVRTIPPEGVQLVNVNDTVQINNDRTFDRHTFFTDHTMATTYQYNSLNQLVRQSMPDHDLMNIWEYTLPNGLDSRLKITATQFVDSKTGYLTGYLGADSARGYLYETADGGATWARVNNMVASDLSTVQMVTPMIGYAVGNHGIIIKTQDAGNSWDMISLSGINIVSPLTDLYFTTVTNGVVVGDNGVVAVTTDGATFTNTAPGVIGADKLLTSITYDGTNLYCSAIDGNEMGHLYKGTVTNPATSLFSVSWAEVTSIRSTNLTAVQAIAADTAFAAGVNGSLLSTTNSGTKWTTLPTGITGNFTDVHFKNANEGVAIINGQLYSTANGGVNWKLISAAGEVYNSFDFYKRDRGYAVGTSGGALGILKRVVMLSPNLVGLVNVPVPLPPANTPPATNITAAFFTDADHGLIVSGTTAYFTGNANAPSTTKVLWISIPGAPAGGIKKIYFSGTTGIALATTGKLYTLAGGVFKQISTSNTYADMDTSVTSGGTLTVYAFNQTLGTLEYIAANTITGSTTGLSSLSPAVNGVITSAIVSLNVINGTAYMAGSNGTLVTGNITNTTATWTDNSQNVRPLALNDVDAATTNVLYAVGDHGTLLQTTDGTNWASLPAPTAANLNAVGVNTANGLIAGNGGYLATLTVAGNGISTVPLSTGNNLYGIALTASDSAYIAGAAGTVVSVPNISSPSPQIAYTPTREDLSSACIKPGSGGSALLVGDNTAMYTYMNTVYGLSGAKVKSIYPPALTDVNFSDVQHGTIVGNTGTIRTTADGGNSWSYVQPANTSGGSNIPQLNGVLTLQQGTAALIVGDAGYVATVSGSTTTPVTIAGGANLYDVASNATGTTYIVGDAGAAFIVSNSLIFAPIAGAPTTALNAVHVFQDGSFMAVGAQNGIYFYNKGTSTWSTYGAPPAITAAQNYNDVFFHDDRTGYVVGNNGVIVRCSLPVNIQTIPGNPTGQFTQQRVSGVNGIPTADSTSLNITSIDFASRYNGFIGGEATGGVTLPTSGGVNYAELVNDETAIFSTRFWYDRLGRLTVSQNTKQFNGHGLYSTGVQLYSYTLYDALGRIIEVGEKPENSGGPLFGSIFGDYINGQYNPNLMSDANLQAWISAGTRTQVTHTYYDTVAIPNLPVAQNNLRKRVSSVTFEDVFDNNPLTYNHATHYSYDVHGNVDTLLQDNPSLAIITPSQQFKEIVYEFDLVSNSINSVSYQDGEPDAFYHFYEYDADNRITAVYSSHYPQKNSLININTVINNSLWDNDAKYFYYAHGPLARTEYGDNNVQGMDYAYTMQNWIKGMNSNTLDTARDMGGDGLSTSINSAFGRDALGYTLNYHKNDYAAIDGLKWNNVNNRFESVIEGSDLNNSRNDLFNANITSMVTTIQKPMVYTAEANQSPTIMPQGTAYNYDQLNRIKEMKAFANLNPATNTWGTGSVYNGMHQNKFNYDANGNITYQERADSNGILFDRLTYKYNLDPSGRLAQNRLYNVNDSAANNLAMDDIKDEGRFTDNADSINAFNNYRYDEIGNLKHDSQEQIDSITWTTYGKIKKIIRISTSTKPDLEFNYDASNNRIAKIVKPHGSSVENGGTDDPSQWTTTYYIRDAEDHIMTIYKMASPASATSFKVTERNIFGSSRLGTENTEIELIAALPAANPFIRTLGNKRYEANNHLGNVLTVFTDRKIPVTRDGTTIDHFDADIVNTFDYTAFGAPMNERTFRLAHVFTDTTTHTDTVWTYVNGNTPLNLIANDSTKYRYGFNGKEKDNEIEGTGDSYDYGVRIYDPRLGRWLSIDPLEEKYPYASPYNFVLNSPISAIDEIGEDVIFLISQSGAGGNGHFALLIQNEEGSWIYVSQGAATGKRGLLAVLGLASSSFKAGLTIENTHFSNADNALNYVKLLSKATNENNAFNANAPITGALKLKTSKDMDAKIYKQLMRLQKLYEKGLKRYNLLTENCADAAKEIVEKGTGTKLAFDADPRPNKYFKKLEQKISKIQAEVDKQIKKDEAKQKKEAAKQQRQAAKSTNN